MSVNVNQYSIRQLLNQATPAQLATILDQLQFGDALRTLPTWIRRANPVAAVANPYVKAGQGLAGPLQVSGQLNSQLPDDAKCAVVLRATPLVGTAAVADLLIDLTAANVTSFATAGTGPAAGHVGVSPSGDIVVNAADAWTSLDVLYIPEAQDPVEIQFSPATAVVAIPAAILASGVANLMEAEILTGTSTGKCAVLPPTNSVTTTTLQASLNLAKTVVNFRVADAPTLVRLKFGVVRNGNIAAGSTAIAGYGSGVDLNSVLGFAAQILG